MGRTSADPFISPVCDGSEATAPKNRDGAPSKPFERCVSVARAKGSGAETVTPQVFVKPRQAGLASAVPAARFSSLIMVRQHKSARRRSRQRLASFGVFPRRVIRASSAPV